MSFIDKLAAFLPFGKKEEEKEYFFAINIGVEKLTAALWTIEGKELKILEIASEKYSSNDEIATVTDRLLDQVLGLKELEPQKILFGVPNSWVMDDNLKDEYLKILRNLVKELELTPMAYVVTAQALIHFLEKQDGVPTTAILVGFEKLHLSVAVVRAGKLDGVKIITRGETSGSDIEKALLAFTDIETLPSKILIYGSPAGELKSQLLSFSWMSKLSFLHFPKIDVLGDDIEIKSVCLAGGSEMNSDIGFTEQHVHKSPVKQGLVDVKGDEARVDDSATKTESVQTNFGFVVGDVASQTTIESESEEEQIGESEELEEVREEELMVSQEPSTEVETPTAPLKTEHKKRLNLRRLIASAKNKFFAKSFTNLVIILGIGLSVALLLGAYIFLPKADVKIFVEPKIVEKDAQVVADPKQKTVDEDAKIIPGQVVETEVSGSTKDSATGKRQIGDSAKGMVKIYNATDQQLVLKTGQILTNDGGIQFKLDKSVNVASKSASAAALPSQSDPVGAIAVVIGADGNIPSSVELKVGNYAKSDVVAKTEGNFSGGNSKDVTVVSSEDQQKLLAKLSSDLRQQAQQKLQDKYPDKKILQEALSENIVKKSYNKSVNDQAGDFSLNMTARFTGTAFEDKDLKLIVSKLVTTQVPDGFQLDLSATETQADVSKLEKDGKLVFLARFKAKLIPKIDTDKVRNQIRFKSFSDAANIIKGMDNILGSEINLTPNLPKPLQRLPILSKNIKIEVGLK